MNNIRMAAVWEIDTRKYYEDRGYVFANYGDRFEVKESDFTQHSKMKIDIECSNCGTFFNYAFRNYYKKIMNGGQILCNECIKKIKIHNVYLRIIEICNNKNYILLTKENEIIDYDTKVFYICPWHGVTYTKVCSLLEGKGCYKCGRKSAAVKQVKTTLRDRQRKLYQDALYAANQKGYTLMSKEEDIVNNTTYIQYDCPKHGAHTMRIANFIFGKGCPDCVADNNSERFRLSPEEVFARFEQYGGTLLNKEDYINRYEKNLRVPCLECGDAFVTSLVNFTQHGGQVCEDCGKVRSIGELKIRKYLKNHNFLIEEQKWFDDCRDIYPLPFDFYLPDINTIIEFDGRQHFEEVEFFASSLKKTCSHDKIKNDYCANNNIHLIRIPYWDINNIDTILDRELILHEDIV